jgi:cytochrome b pre-mRNA-processing protein 3
VDRLHGGIVAAVRQPALYSELGVADTFDGRFELLALFSTLAIRRLMSAKPSGPELAQDLTDGLFRHLDNDLREIGVGDLTVPKKIKKLASALLGRRNAYDRALAKGDDRELSEAVARNVYASQVSPGDPRIERLARYIKASEATLANAPDSELMNGAAPFPDIQTIA